VAATTAAEAPSLVTQVAPRALPMATDAAETGFITGAARLLARASLLGLSATILLWEGNSAQNEREIAALDSGRVKPATPTVAVLGAMTTPKPKRKSRRGRFSSLRCRPRCRRKTKEDDEEGEKKCGTTSVERTKSHGTASIASKPPVALE
jgi:hypothetical protein